MTSKEKVLKAISGLKGDGHPPDDVCEGGVGRGVAGEGGDANPVEGPRVDGGGGRA